MKLYWRHGFDGTTTARLAAEMGITPPSLYAAFGSKEGLFREALDLYSRKNGGFITESFAEGGTIRAQIARMMRKAAHQFSQEDGCRGCMIATGELHAAPDTSAMAHLLKSLRMNALDAILARLGEARQTGELPAGANILALATFFAATIQGMAVQARDGAAEDLLEALADLSMKAWPGRIEDCEAP